MVQQMIRWMIIPWEGNTSSSACNTQVPALHYHLLLAWKKRITSGAFGWATPHGTEAIGWLVIAKVTKGPDYVCHICRCLSHHCVCPQKCC